jgi:hypothetical protein
MRFLIAGIQQFCMPPALGIQLFAAAGLEVLAYFNGPAERSADYQHKRLKNTGLRKCKGI